MLSPDRPWGVAGIAFGLCLAVTTLFASRVADGAGGLGAEVRITVSPIGELSVAPSGPFLSAIDLRPAGRAGGRTLIGNQTGVALTVSVQAERSTPDLDDQVQVRVLVDGRLTADALLGELSEKWGSVVVPSGHEADVTFEVSLAPGAQRYQGRVVDVDLRLAVKRVGA